MLSNNKSILVYNAPKEEVSVLKNQGIKVVEVSPEMAEMTITDILGGLKFETISDSLPNESVILFNDFSDEEIKIAIKNIRQRFKGGIFAAVTPTSIQWEFSYLVEHLIEEREWYRSMQGGKA